MLGPTVVQLFTVAVDNSIRMVLNSIFRLQKVIFRLPKAIFRLPKAILRLPKTRRGWRRILYHLRIPGFLFSWYGTLIFATCWRFGLFFPPPPDYPVLSPLWRRAMRRLCRQLMRRTRKYTIRRASQFLGHLQRFGGLLWTLWSSLSTAQQLVSGSVSLLISSF